MTQIIPPSDADWAAHSRFVQRLRRRYANELVLLPPGAPTLANLQLCYQTLRARWSCGDALRILRQLVMERLVTLDSAQQASLATITRAVTELAEFALEEAYQEAQQQLD
ncbi:MAG: glutamine-synthetase adenylyltransferase, partial [Limnohabitans sp.]